MNHPLNQLITAIDRTVFGGSSAIFPFDPLFGQVHPSLLEALVLYEAAAPRVPRRLVWETAVVCARHWLARFDQEYLERAEALPAMAAEGYVMERMIAHALRGRARMEYLRAEPHPAGDRDAFARGAREDLDLAAALAEEHHRPRVDLFVALVSAGNAWRTPPGADPTAAISRYERATRVGAANPEEGARLAKCHADGLVARGMPADLDQAIALLQHSLEVRRRGPYESVTLLSLVTAERAKRQERKAADCEHVHRILVAAQRSDAGANAEAIARVRIEVLSAWVRHEPDAREPTRALDDIVARFPELGREVEFARSGGVAALATLVESVVRLGHPAVMACHEVLLAIEERLLERHLESMGPLRGLPPGKMEEVARHFRERSIASDPEGLAALAEALRVAPLDDATPGRLVGRARTLARLVLFGRATRGALTEAMRDAEAAVCPMEAPAVRAFLLLELATVWGPTDLAHPAQDFAEAARLNELAVAAARDDAHLELDALLRLARATQHRSDGELRVHHERATAIYEDIIRRAPALGADVTMASARQNLGALATTRGTGAQHDRSTAALAHGDIADRLGNSMAVANRAWEFTAQAARQGGAAGAELLRQALALFARVGTEALSEAERLNVEHNRTVAETMALELDGHLAEAAQRWRHRLEDPDVRRRPDLLARTRHSLGEQLSRHADTVDEGLRLLEAALEGRPLDRSPREHWETNISIVRALGAELARGMPWRVRRPRAEAYRRAVSAARGAVKAGRRLGAGDELARAGQELGRLALLAAGDDDFAALMEEGWRAISDALPCMLGDAEAEEVEARLAEAAALRVFGACRRRAPVGPGGVEALQGEAAAGVLGWMERAMLPQQRRLAARFAQPAWCDDARWQAWGVLLEGKDPLAIARWVEGARKEHPDFLDPGANPVDTLEWLRTSSDRGVLALLPTSQGVLVAVETAAAGLNVALLGPPQSVALEELPGLLANLSRAPEAMARIEAAAVLTHASLIAPMQALLGAPLGCVRVALGATLRWLPPSALLPDTVLHMAPSMRMPKRPAVDSRSMVLRVALIAADPDMDLGSGVDGIAQFSQALGATAQVTTALGRGARWGRGLGIPAEGLVERPPSPNTLFELAAAADVVVLLAHGNVIDADGPAMRLMDAAGKAAAVGARGIAARSAALAGRHLVLLSCEAGFVEAAPHRLGLLLGELLACGPASVTAASWAVSVESALTVGRFVVHALLQGREPEEGLKEAIRCLLTTETDGGPLLGGRITAADQRAGRTAEARAWATWRP
jgi:hypothetical protein